MKQRPILKIPLSNLDKVLEISSFLLLLLLWIYVFIHVPSLPDAIPTHFGLNGKVDSFGSKYTIFALPILTTVMLAGLTFLNRYPHIFNYLTEITQENAFVQYQAAQQVIRILKISLTLTFGFVTFAIISNTQGKMDGFSIWFLLPTLVLVLVPVLYFILTKK
jgi:uncharacterized membrane protein